MKLFLAALAASAVAGAGTAHAGDLVDCYTNIKDGCTDVGPYAVPTSAEQLVTLRDTLAKDPWGGATVTLLAFLAWQADPKLNESMLVLAVSERSVGKGKGVGSYNGYVLGAGLKSYLRLVERYQHCTRSYVVGATPANRYTIDPTAVSFRIYKPAGDPPLDPAATTQKVFVCTSGADSCRPMTMTVNKRGLWKSDELSSLLAGCKAMTPLPTADDAAEAL